MIDFYTAATPNGYKVAIALEELALPYELRVLDMQAREQKQPWFLRINPNGRIPAIVDRAACDFPVFESGAILVYLAEKTGRLLPMSVKGRSEVLQWVMFQVAGIGPVQGQAHAFVHYLPWKMPAAIARFRNEARRLYEVLDVRLRDREYLCGDYSIADIATWPWIRRYAWPGIDIAGWITSGAGTARWRAVPPAGAAARARRVPRTRRLSVSTAASLKHEASSWV